MVNILRRWNQPIMVVITILVIVSFMYFGPNIAFRDSSSNVQAKLYGEEIKRDEWKRIGRRVGVHAQLDGPYIRALDPGFNFQNPKVNGEMVARSIVLDQECERLGITSTPNERKDMLESLDGLKKRDYFGRAEGSFEPEAFMYLKERTLNPNGFSDNDFDRVFLDGEVRAKKLQDLIGQTTSIPTAELRKTVAEQQLKNDPSFVAFKRADFRKDVKATEEELKKSYEEGKATYKTPEMRKVRYASFLKVEPADGKQLTSAQSLAQMQKLANSAYDFAQELKKPNADFDKLAKAAGGTVGETKEFFAVTDSPKEFDESSDVAEAAFTLSKEHPYSTHLKVEGKGSFVLELKEIKAPEQKSFEAVKAEVEDKVLSGKAKDAALAKAKELQPKIAEGIKAGKKFREVAQALNLKVEEFPSYSRDGRLPETPYLSVVPTAVTKLAPGQISEVLSDTATGDALIVHLDSRSAADDKAIDKDLAEYSDNFVNRQLRPFLFQSWLKERELAAGMHTAFARGVPEE